MTNENAYNSAKRRAELDTINKILDPHEKQLQLEQFIATERALSRHIGGESVLIVANKLLIDHEMQRTDAPPCYAFSNMNKIATQTLSTVSDPLFSAAQKKNGFKNKI